MRVIWVGHPTECEFDMAESCRQAGIDFVVYQIGAYLVQMAEGEVQGPSAGKYYGMNRHTALLEQLMEEPSDLIIFRYPYWVMADSDHFVPLIRKLEEKRRVVVWSSQQGHTQFTLSLAPAKRFHNIAIDNHVDQAKYVSLLPDHNIYRLPAGCAKWGPEALVAKEQYGGRDIVSDGNPHYSCYPAACAMYKKLSVETMLFPLAKYSLSVYGSNNLQHAWPGIPELKDQYRGFYQPPEHTHVYASHRLYVGITWNWNFGGYGIKMGRALSTGIPVIWQRTVGAELEGLVEGEHVEYSGSAAETKEKVDYYLAHPEKCKQLGQAGQKWVRANWDWASNFVRLANEISN